MVKEDSSEPRFCSTRSTKLGHSAGFLGSEQKRPPVPPLTFHYPTLSLIKQHPGKQSNNMKRRMAGWSVDFLMQILTGKGT